MLHGCEMLMMKNENELALGHTEMRRIRWMCGKTAG